MSEEFNKVLAMLVAVVWKYAHGKAEITAEDRAAQPNTRVVIEADDAGTFEVTITAISKGN